MSALDIPGGDNSPYARPAGTCCPWRLPPKLRRHRRSTVPRRSGSRSC